MCADIVRTLGKYLDITPKNFKNYDAKMQEAAGVTFLRLNGCVDCNKFVYLPDDPRTQCLHVKEDGTVCGSR